MQHNCSDCDYLKRTSPTQVFLLCKFWSAKQIPVVGTNNGYDFVLSHCHMQPEAPACAFFRPRAVRHGAAGVSRPVPCAD